MADGSCPATNQRSWKDRSGAVLSSTSSQESPRQLIRRCNTRLAPWNAPNPRAGHAGWGRSTGHSTGHSPAGSHTLSLLTTSPLPGHRPLKAEIVGSNPARATKKSFLVAHGSRENILLSPNNIHYSAIIDRLRTPRVPYAGFPFVPGVAATHAPRTSRGTNLQNTQLSQRIVPHTRETKESVPHTEGTPLTHTAVLPQRSPPQRSHDEDYHYDGQLLAN